MLRTRVIPTLLLRNESLVKTVQFRRFNYIGDPCNTVRIFNELEVDELLFLDITATREGRMPNLGLLRDIANECFMPVGYGGGINSLEAAKKVFDIGFEKIVVNSALTQRPELIRELSSHYGSQAIIASIDVRNDWRGRQRVYQHTRGKDLLQDPVEWARTMQEMGAGEILLTSVDREGTWSGFDLELVRRVTAAVSIPVIAHGGAGCLADIGRAVSEGKAAAVAVGSLVVFQKKGMGVLVNFPGASQLREVFT
jgi:cyclase